MEAAEVSDLAPSKRAKIAAETLASPGNPNSKGKEKILVEDPDLDREPDDEDGDNDDGDDEEDRTCGICFTEEGAMSIRGEIDSCVHYFCFVCIMEWSKVESRCPLCKRRFASIRRPPVVGLFPVERTVRVPERNQVYHPLGNVSEGPVDAYADVLCSYCQSSSNEHLLLLCDLCDSAAHTYCVGLGYDVPEGDWFCVDCMVSKNQHSKIEVDDNSGNRYSHDNLGGCNATGSPVSISEIVADEFPFISPEQSSPSEFPTRHVSSIPVTLVNRRDYSSHPESLVNDTRANNASVLSSDADIAGQTARTLRRCRDIHGRIQRFRENWDNLRNGTLTFGLTCIDSNKPRRSRKTGKKRRRPAVPRCRASLFPDRESHATKETKPSDVSTSSSSSTEADRAWRMMETARLVHPVAKLTFSGLQEQKLQKGTSLCNKERRLCPIVAESRLSGVKAPNKIVGRSDHRHISPRIEKTDFLYKNDHVKRSANVVMRPQMQEERPEMNHKKNSYLIPAHQELEVSKKEVLSERKLQPSACGSRTSTYLGTTTCATLGSSGTNTNKISSDKFMSLEKESICRRKLCEGQDDARSIKIIANCEAKGEIQSIVKLNMKLQRINKCLGSEGFKKVARIATHTILAACGLDHSESIARKVPKEICKHSQHIKHAKHSTLMPGSCRECFYAFARDVVADVSSELVTQASLGSDENSVCQV